MQERAQRTTPEEEKKLTIGEVLLLLLASLLSLPVAAAEEAFIKTNEQAEHAA
jgi:hypothetical protein